MGSCIPIPKQSSHKQLKISNVYSQNKDIHTTNSTTQTGNHTPPELMQPLIDQNITDNSSVSASLGSNIITNHNQTPDNLQQVSDTSNRYDHSEIDVLMANDTLTLLSVEQSNKLKQDGFCMLSDPLNRDLQIRYTVEGFIRHNYNGRIVTELIREIIYYYGTIFNTNIYMELVCNTVNPKYFLVPKISITLSAVLKDMDEKINKIELTEYTENKSVDIDTLQNVLKYLGHHKGREPDALPCPVRSIHMAQICSDQWDAAFMDSFLEKKPIFEIILLANQLKIQSLLHLGCAKIATLIKQLDQKEINRIIEEEEKYRREHAADNDNDNEDNDDDSDNDNDNEIVLERKCTDLVDRNSDEYEKEMLKNEMNE